MKPTLIAHDNGYGYGKALANNKLVQFPSVVGNAERIRYTGHLLNEDGDKINGIHLVTDAGEHFVGDLALLQSRSKRSPQDRRRTGTDTNLILALAALSELNISGPVKLITGLPVQWYDKDKDLLVKQLQGEHLIHRKGRGKPVTVDIEEVVVTIQPFGALFSATLNDAGRIIAPELAAGSVGVVDIGMHTTDYIVAKKFNYIEPASGHITDAMGTVYDLVARQISDTYDRQLNLHETDQAVRRGKVSVRGHKHDIVDLVESALQEVAANIGSALATAWERYEDDLDTILVAGGGSSLIGPYLAERYPHLAMLPNGGIANVTGYYRYGLKKWPDLAPAAAPAPPARSRKTSQVHNGATAPTG